ncbi:MAG: helix-turn-helix domain-containing protein [Akkermansiaceae bacterium]|jgi:cytoskeletal protein RodZ|nr:helix-turn-helix domain-containing protein [Akkermansiaceae bacterium]
MSEWTDIGEKLKGTREKRDLSLGDISHEMRIPIGTLRALEENDYSGFPSPTYAKSFLSQYSNYLQIDAHDWLDRFETGNVLVHSDNLDYLVPDDPEPRQAVHSRPAKPKKSSRSGKVEESSGNSGQTALIFLITGGLIAGAVWGFIQIERKITSEDPPVTKQEPASFGLTPATPPDQPKTIEETPVILPPLSIIPGIPPGLPSVPLNPRVLSESGITEPVFVKPTTDKPPPRAILVEED